jgi:hypothetical protein
MEGVPVGGETFLFLTTGFDWNTGNYSHSVLASMPGLDVGALTLRHMVPSAKFINVSVVVDGDTAFVYGSGPYRKSAVYLARVPVAQLADRGAWRYYTGPGQAFAPGEGGAAPLVTASCVGELSVRRFADVGLYFMAYNCDAPRGIHLRWARAPEGPWSDPLVIFDPGRDADHGYEHFIHARQSVAGHDDGRSEPARYDEWGGEYGPYLVPRWFAEEPGGVLTLAYTLSSWNPYQVHVLRTRVALEDTPWTPPGRGEGLPPATLANADFRAGLAGWSQSGDAFAVFTGADGAPRITTYVPDKGDATVGRLWQDFTVDAGTSELAFAVHGGDAEVRLVDLSSDEVVRATRGRRDNGSELPVVWQLSELRGKTVRLVVDDSLTGPWGFVSVSGFVLR